MEIDIFPIPHWKEGIARNYFEFAGNLLVIC